MGLREALRNRGTDDGVQIATSEPTVFLQEVPRSVSPTSFDSISSLASIAKSIKGIGISIADKFSKPSWPKPKLWIYSSTDERDGEVLGLTRRKGTKSKTERTGRSSKPRKTNIYDDHHTYEKRYLTEYSSSSDISNRNFPLTPLGADDFPPVTAQAPLRVIRTGHREVASLTLSERPTFQDELDNHQSDTTSYTSASSPSTSNTEAHYHDALSHHSLDSKANDLDQLRALIDASWATGWDIGWEVGWDVGENAGWNAGWRSGWNSGWEAGFAAAAKQRLVTVR